MSGTPKTMGARHHHGHEAKYGDSLGIYIYIHLILCVNLEDLQDIPTK